MEIDLIPAKATQERVHLVGILKSKGRVGCELSHPGYCAGKTGPGLGPKPLVYDQRFVSPFGVELLQRGFSIYAIAIGERREGRECIRHIVRLL